MFDSNVFYNHDHYVLIDHLNKNIQEAPYFRLPDGNSLLDLAIFHHDPIAIAILRSIGALTLNAREPSMPLTFNEFFSILVFSIQKGCVELTKLILKNCPQLIIELTLNSLNHLLMIAAYYKHDDIANLFRAMIKERQPDEEDNDIFTLEALTDEQRIRLQKNPADTLPLFIKGCIHNKLILRMLDAIVIAKNNPSVLSEILQQMALPTDNPKLASETIQQLIQHHSKNFPIILLWILVMLNHTDKAIKTLGLQIRTAAIKHAVNTHHPLMLLAIVRYGCANQQEIIASIPQEAAWLLQMGMLDYSELELAVTNNFKFARDFFNHNPEWVTLLLTSYLQTGNFKGILRTINTRIRSQVDIATQSIPQEYLTQIKTLQLLSIGNRAPGIVSLRRSFITAGILHFLSLNRNQVLATEQRCLLHAMTLTSELNIHEKYFVARQSSELTASAAANDSPGSEVELTGTAGFHAIPTTDLSIDETIPHYIQLLILHLQSCSIKLDETDAKIKTQSSGRFNFLTDGVRSVIGEYLTPIERKKVTAVNRYENQNRHYWFGSLFKPKTLSVSSQLDILNRLIPDIESIHYSSKQFFNKLCNKHICKPFCCGLACVSVFFLPAIVLISVGLYKIDKSSSYLKEYCPDLSCDSIQMNSCINASEMCDDLSSGQIQVDVGALLMTLSLMCCYLPLSLGLYQNYVKHNTHSFLTHPDFSDEIKSRCLEILAKEDCQIDETCSTQKVLALLNLMRDRLREIQKSLEANSFVSIQVKYDAAEQSYSSPKEDQDGASSQHELNDQHDSYFSLRDDRDSIDYSDVAGPADAEDFRKSVIRRFG